MKMRSCQDLALREIPEMSLKFQKVKYFQSKAKPRNFIRQEVKPRIFDSFEYQEAPETHEPKRKRPQMVWNYYNLHFLKFFSSSKSKKASCRAWNFAKQKLWDKWKILRRLRRFLFRKIMIMVIWILKIQIYYRFFEILWFLLELKYLAIGDRMWNFTKSWKDKLTKLPNKL